VIVGGRRFLLVGHRGAAARAPENTAASLSAGLAAGADQIEIDVGLTRDGRAILLHDTTLDRTTTGRGPLRARGAAHVLGLDAGSWFSPRFSGEPPIDLDEALAIVRPRVPLIVEIKPARRERERGIDPVDRATVEAVLAAFERTGGLRGVTVSSSAWTLLEHAASRAPGVDLALTVRGGERRDPIAWARRTGATALHPNRRLCSPAFVGRARGLGLLVVAYTVNRAAEMAALIEVGADGIFTDDPAAMRRVLERSGSRAGDERGPLSLGIDQGSGGTRAVLLDAEGSIAGAREVRVVSRRTTSGAIVQDADAIAASVLRAAGPLVERAGAPVATAGLAVQRSSLLVWKRRDAEPVTPVLSWRTGIAYAPAPSIRAAEEEIHRATGLTGRYPYGAIRLAGLLAESADVARGLREGRFVAGPLGAFLAARLAGEGDAACDPSLAQRTLAYDIHDGTASEALAGILGVPAASWIGVSPSTGRGGTLRLGRRRVALRALCGDVGAAVRGMFDDVAAETDGAMILGTGGFVIVPSGRSARRVPGLLTSILYEDADGPVFGVEGTVHGLAAGLVEAGRRGGWDELAPERIASKAGSARRAARVVAAIEGTGTPGWEVTPRFTVEAGVRRAEEIVAGTLDDLASRFAAIAAILREAASLPARFAATGGLAFAPHLTTRIAAAAGVPVVVDPRPHRTAAGVALLSRDGR